MNSTSDSSSLRDILNVPFKHWGLIISVLSASLMVGLAYVVISDPVYTATSKLLVQLGREKTAALAADPQPSANVSFQERPQNINNEIEILRDTSLMEHLLPAIRSRLQQVTQTQQQDASPVAGLKRFISELKEKRSSVMQSLGVARPLSPEREFLLKLLDNLSVDFTKETDVINIRFQWTDPDFAAFVANLYVDAYQEKRIQIHGVGNSFDFYQDQLTEFRQQLAVIEDSIADFLQSGRISNIDSEKAVALAYITELDKELIQTRITLDDVRQKVSKIENSYNKSGEWIETPESGDGEASIQALDRSFVALSTERTSLLARFSSNYPAVVSMDQQLQQLREQKFVGLQSLYSARARALLDKATVLESKIRAKKVELALLGDRTLAYDRLIRRQTEVQSQVAYYRKKVEDLKINEDLDARNVSSVKVISPATPPMLPSAPRKALILFLAGFIGLFFGIALAVIAEFFNHTFRHEQDVRRVLGVPLLSTVPHFRH